MPPVEGDKYFGEVHVGQLDSTEPGETQYLTDFAPATLDIFCDVFDTFGMLHVDDETDIVSVQKFSEENAGEPKTLDKTEPVIFSGNEQVLVTKLTTGFVEHVALRHRTGDPEQPPFTRERVPLVPKPPLLAEEAEIRPEERAGELTVIGSKN